MNNPRVNEISFLITDGLGYCCEAFFFQAFKDVPTGLISTRLGCVPATVSKHRRRFRLGEFKCTDCSECLNKRLEKRDANTDS